MNLKSMSVDRLKDLRDRVAAALSAKVVEQRQTLESELTKLTRFQGGARSVRQGNCSIAVRWSDILHFSLAALRGGK